MAGEATEKTALAAENELQQIKNSLTDQNKLMADLVSVSAGNNQQAQADADSIRKGIEQGNKKEHPAPSGWWTSFLNHHKWMKSEANRAKKLAKLGAGKVMDFAKAGAKKVEHFAKNILDLLLKGLGLAALWALFKWMSTADWEKIYKDAKKWILELVGTWETITAAWEVIWGIMKPLVGMLWLKWVLQGKDGKGGIKGLFGKDGWFNKTYKIFKAFSFAKWFGKFSPFQTLLGDIKKVFGPKSTIGGAIGPALKAMKDWVKLKLFNFSSPFRSLLRWIKGIFGPGGTIITQLKEWKKMGMTKMFGPQSAFGQKLTWIKSFFGEQGKIATWLKEWKANSRFAKWFGEGSKFRGMITAIKGWFGPGSFIFGVIDDIKKTTIFKALFGPESPLRRLTRWITGFFGGGKTGLKGATDVIEKGEKLKKVKDFLGKIGKNFLKFLGPVIWLVAAYDAIAGEGGFMDEFNKDTGSLWDKTIAGLGGAAKRLADFFIFDLMGLFEDGAKWVAKKLLGLFGYSEKEVEGMEWYKFSVTEFLREHFGHWVDLFKGILTFDGALIKKALKGIWGGLASAIDWLFDMVVRKPINAIAKYLGFSEELISEEFSLSKWIKESIIDPIWNVLKSIFEFDYMKFIKESTVLSWLARKAGILPPTKEEAEEKLKELDAEIKEQKEELASGDKKTWTGRDRALLLKQAEEEKAALLKSLKAGNISALPTEKPPAKKIPLAEAQKQMGGHASHAVNVEGSNIRNDTTNTLIPTSSHNPSQQKYLAGSTQGLPQF